MSNETVKQDSDAPERSAHFKLNECTLACKVHDITPSKYNELCNKGFRFMAYNPQGRMCWCKKVKRHGGHGWSPVDWEKVNG